MAPSKLPEVRRVKSKTTLQWIIVRLPILKYSTKLNINKKCIIVRDEKKKLFKKFLLVELIKYNLPAEEENFSYSQCGNILTITYKKPQKLIDIEEELFQEKKRACPDIPNECKAQ